LYSNRSAAYTAIKNYEEAIKDAEQAISLNPTWSKGHSRKAAALQGAGRLEEAKKVYQDALAIEPNSAAMKNSLAEVERALKQQQTSGGDTNNFFSQFNPFTKPNAIEKVLADPSMKEYIAQSDFMPKLVEIAANPSALSKHLQDPRILQAVMVAMGVNVKTNPSGEKSFSYESGPKSDSKEPKAVPAKAASVEEVKEASPGSSWEDVRHHDATPSEANWRDASVRETSDKLKDLGNSAYKNCDFVTAISHYDAAFEADPSNVAVLNNKAAVFFEQGDFDACIAVCEQAAEKGRELFADFKIIAKSYGRMGSAYMKKEDYGSAIKYFNKSLTEHRTPDILAKLKEAEILKVQQEKAAYRNPELAEAARASGNESFKAGNFTEAMKHYNEAIKRNEKDPRGFSNRAACFTKLMAFPEALKDCDAAVALDRTFVKAYIRKASIYLAMKRHDDCFQAIQEAKSFDTERLHSVEIDRLLSQYYQAMHTATQTASQLSPEETMERAMQDPELMSIMSDPVMQQILQQMQSDPKALMDHMKNPMIAAKIRKLIAAGIIRTA
jgi:stress-induced-phosphoprotein 1